ncbi:MAG: sigma-70 family RNA polymerase sigma factor [Firmicutes bacterium]|nr:sigma-70 family RNA polymerase sigma factor [[Eubacterium] siraeum]MCM1487446.1 sigma-70 family RNA polymerase sigma factor [Bacillota bacterium]
MIEAAVSMLKDDEQRNDLAVFYEQYKKRFFGIAYSKLHNSEEAEDAIQEAFLRVADNPAKFFNMPNKEQLWFVDGIVRHISVDKFNKNNKLEVISTEDIRGDVIDDRVSPEERYITSESVSELVQFVLTLPESQRQALFMYIHQKLSYSEISQILGISEELARKRVSNARKAIKNFAERKNR